MSSIGEYLVGLPPARHRSLCEQVTAAVLAVELCRRCVESPGGQSESVRHLRQYVGQAMTALQRIEATLAADS